MSRYNANTVIEGRYLLIENISRDSKSGRQVWSAKDNQTGKRVLGRFESNGKIEWFPDTRTLTSNSSKQKISTVPKIAIPIVKLPQGSSKFRRFIPLLLLFGVGLISIVYYQKGKIRDFWEAKFSNSNSEQVEEVKQDADEVNAESLSADTTLSDMNPSVEEPNRPAQTPPSTAKSRPVIDTPIETTLNQKIERSVDNPNVVGTVSPIGEKPRADVIPKRDQQAIPKPQKKKPSLKQNPNTFVTDSELNKN